MEVDTVLNYNWTIEHLKLASCSHGQPAFYGEVVSCDPPELGSYQAVLRVHGVVLVLVLVLVLDCCSSSLVGCWVVVQCQLCCVSEVVEGVGDSVGSGN